MVKRLLLYLVLSGSMNFAALQVAAAPGAESTSKPNIVFLFADDLGWRDAGFMGSAFYQTPHLDRLAKQGMVLTSAYAAAPNCAPSRACLLSGMAGPRHGIYTVGTAARGNARHRRLIPTGNKTVLRSDISTIAETLRDAGYATGHFGKWHMGSGQETLPTGQGFDVNIGGFAAGHPKSYFSPYRNPHLPDGPDGEYLTDRLGDEACRFIDARRAGPFFLYLPFYTVHTPIQAKAALAALFKDKPPHNGQSNADYAAMIASLDENIGKVLAKLDEHKLSNNTIVVFTSDNGGVGRVTSNQPLRGAKGMLYEGGIRVPLIVRWPGHIKAGARSDEPVINLDFYPTFAAVAGAKLPDAAVQPLDGEDLLPLLTGKGRLQREAIYWHFPAYLEGRSAAGARDKIFRTRPAAAIRSGDWKLIEYFEDGQLELYNLKEDMGEQNNVADANKEQVRTLHQLMKQWRKDTHAPVPTTPNPKYVDAAEE